MSGLKFHRGEPSECTAMHLTFLGWEVLSGLCMEGPIPEAGLPPGIVLCVPGQGALVRVSPETLDVIVGRQKVIQ